jgi:hypothetical protein
VKTQRAALSGLALLLFFFAAALYHLSSPGRFQGQDATPNTFLPVTVLADGNLAFRPLEMPFMFIWEAKTVHGDSVYVDILRWDQILPSVGVPAWRYHQAGLLRLYGPRYFVVPTIRHRTRTGERYYVGAFGPVAGLTALPLAAMAQAIGLPLTQDWDLAYAVGRLAAELLVAASVAMVFLTALALTTTWRALLLAAAYGFGTCVWSISAQQLWQQTPELFFLSLGVLCLVRGSNVWIRGAAAGLAFSLAAACRPTAAIVAVAAVVYLIYTHRRAAIVFVLSGLPIAAALLAYNTYYFGSPLDFGQLAAGVQVAKFKTGVADVWQTPIWVGAGGLLLSPSRGMLVYSPFLAAAFAGSYLAWKDARYVALRWMSVAVPLLWIPAFTWFDWWGGWTYGYRPIVDSAPLLAVLCLPALERAFASTVWRTVLASAVAWSALVQVLGVYYYSAAEWNARRIEPGGALANIDLPQYRSRLWSWTDWQIGYLLQKASSGLRGGI